MSAMRPPLTVRNRRAALLGGPDPGRPERLPDLGQRFLPRARICGRLVTEPVLPGEDVEGGPQRGGVGVAPGRGAEHPAVPHAIAGYVIPVAGPQGDLEPFAQVRGRVLATAGPHVQVGHQHQQERQG
jgi:hypothetical protein